MGETTTLHLTGHISPADREANPHLMIPFDVPEGIAELDVSYTYSDKGSREPHAPADNQIDVGIFGPGATPFPCERGFRGWSGTARDTFRISPESATPGYISGLIQPGCWHVLLGAYKLIPAGTDYDVTVRLIPGQVGQDAILPYTGRDSIPSYTSRMLRTGPAWFRGDLHCHTHHSDGKGTLQNLLDRAAEAGLDFLAVTEHNTVSHYPELAAYSGPILLIPGQEITSYKGHANVWGCDRWLDFRAHSPKDMAWVVEQAHRSGALISINHPKYDGPDWELGQEFDVDGVEAWQAPWFVSNYESLAFWERMLNAGRRVSLVGGSDCHVAASSAEQGLPYLAQPTTWVWAEELSVRGILAGFRAGHVHVSASSDGPHLRFTAETSGQRAMAGDVLHATHGETILFRVGAQGGDGLWLRIVSGEGEVARWVMEGDDFSTEWVTSVDEDGWYRLDLLNPLEPEEENDPSAVLMEAMTNPIYIQLSV
jgi:hypothetical protein